MKRALPGFVVLAVTACAAANGYDPDRYESAPPPSVIDPETQALPKTKRTRLYDPRNEFPRDAEVPDAPHVLPATPAGP